MIKILDDWLPIDYVDGVEKLFFKNHPDTGVSVINWHLNSYTVDSKYDTYEQDMRENPHYIDIHQFTHNFYSGCQTMSSHFNNMIMPLLNKFPRVKSLIRVKGNLYPKTDILYHHNDHIDMDFDHKGAIYYVNSNNGFTVIGDQKIESVANRMLFFNPQVLHHSTTCTNEYARVNINFNYF